MLHLIVNKEGLPPDFEVLGCPIGDGKAECWPRCGGWYPISTKALTKAVLNRRINPQKLCGPLAERIIDAQKKMGLSDLKE